MRKVIIFCIALFINFLSTTLFAQQSITSSTYFSQEIQSLSPTVEVLTSEDIKLLGAENIPELLNILSGVLVNRVNASTADYYLRGFFPELKINPVLLIDGMQLTEDYYKRTFLLNVPVTIDDIDRVEIIKDTSAFSNGYIAPAGIINIVTKHPQYLDNNYINVQNGSRNLQNYNFSVNNYLLSTYWKLTGNIREVKDFNSSKRINKQKMLNLSTINYWGNSQLFVKGSFAENDITFKEGYIVGINHKDYLINFNERFKDLKEINFLINYKYPHIDTSLYYNGFKGKIFTGLVKGKSKVNTLNEWYKYSFRYSYKKLLVGFEYKYSHIYIEGFTSCYDYTISPFLEYNINFFKNFNFKLTLRNDKIRNSGSNFSYKFNIGYSSNDKTFTINAGYIHSKQAPPMYVKYTDLNAILSAKDLGVNGNFNINLFFHKNTDIKPVKVTVTDLTILKKWQNFLFKTTFFYNRVTNVINQMGIFKLKGFVPTFDIYSKNFMNFAFWGFESQFSYKIKNNIKFFGSYMLQHAKNKNFNSFNDYLPEYKIVAGLLFKFPFIEGSVVNKYIPLIKAHTGEKSDYIFSTDLNLIKKLLHNKMELSLHIENLFNDVHRESYYGEKIGRMVYLKLKYNF